ncbi:hypothetical protein AURDEDRAFT_123578 [Auricularia subglabra TFB-10046 SS5]|nr:hypothetical protein AURDEDRAFT_123578 [Auricularia subglabra TFB-10046 SS5]
MRFLPLLLIAGLAAAQQNATECRAACGEWAATQHRRQAAACGATPVADAQCFCQTTAMLYGVQECMLANCPRLATNLLEQCRMRARDRGAIDENGSARVDKMAAKPLEAVADLGKGDLRERGLCDIRTGGGRTMDPPHSFATVQQEQALPFTSLIFFPRTNMQVLAILLAASSLALAQDAAGDITRCRTACKEQPAVVDSLSFFLCTKNGTLTDADTRTRCACRDVKLFFDVQTCMTSTCPALQPQFRDECDDFTLNGATARASLSGIFGAALTGVALLWSLSV